MRMMPAMHAQERRTFGQVDGEPWAANEPHADVTSDVQLEDVPLKLVEVHTPPVDVWTRVSTADLVDLLQVRIFDPGRAADVNVLRVDGEEMAIPFTSNLEVLAELSDREEGKEAWRELWERTREVRGAVEALTVAELGGLMDHMHHVSGTTDAHYLLRSLDAQRRLLSPLKKSADVSLSIDAEVVLSRIATEIEQVGMRVAEQQTVSAEVHGSLGYATHVVETGVAAMRSKKEDGRENYLHMRTNTQRIEASLRGLMEALENNEPSDGLVSRWNDIEALIDTLESWMDQHTFAHLPDAFELVSKEAYRVGDVVRGTAEEEPIARGALQVTLERLQDELEYLISALNMA